MKILMTAVALALLLTASLFAEERKACDLAKVASGFYCETDELVLVQADLVSEVACYECADCKETYREEGDCESCETPMKAKKSGKNVCAECLQTPVSVEVCEKEVFACPDCEEQHAAAGKCADCEVALKATKSRGVVQYSCDECGESRHKAGACTDEDCAKFKQPLVRACSLSGTPPHVAKAAAKSAK